MFRKMRRKKQILSNKENSDRRQIGVIQKRRDFLFAYCRRVCRKAVLQYSVKICNWV